MFNLLFLLVNIIWLFIILSRYNLCRPEIFFDSNIKSFEFVLYNSHTSFTFNFLLILLLLEQDLTFKESRYKKYLFITFSFEYSQMVLILFKEIIVIYIKHIFIYI